MPVPMQQLANGTANLTDMNQSILPIVNNNEPFASYLTLYFLKLLFGSVGVSNGSLIFTSLSPPNGTITAREASDITIEGDGKVWQALSAGDMDWFNTGVNLRGPAGNGTGNGSFNMPVSTDYVGFLYGDGSQVQGIDPTYLTYYDAGPGIYLSFHGGVGGLQWQASDIYVNESGGYWAIGTGMGPVWAITPATRDITILGPSLILSGSTYISLGEDAAIGVPLGDGWLAFNTTEFVPVYSYASQWRRFGGNNTSTAKAEAWDPGVTYTPGNIVMSADGYAYVSLTTNIASDPTTNPADWTLISVYGNGTSNGTIGDILSRLQTIEDQRATAFDGVYSWLDGDGVTNRQFTVDHGFVATVG